jgi:Predicted membrane protein
MAKVILIEMDIVTIGNDDGTIIEISSRDFNFSPQIGDSVEIFRNRERFIVSKIMQPPANIPGGINVTVTNPTSNPYVLANGQRLVNKTIYLLITFFLGGIGGHKFYTGKTFTGILFFLFCWTGIPALIALIDFIIGLTKPSDAQGNIIV